MIQDEAMMIGKSPVVIGGTGGSGTRLVAKLCLAANYDLGLRLNQSYDALDFLDFYRDWINPYLLRKKSPLSLMQVRTMKNQFYECLFQFISSLEKPDHWGWKNPRSLFLLPFLDSCIQDLRFIHIVRDGRDMALSKNQNQLRDHGHALLDEKYQIAPPEIQSIAFWNKANVITATYGESIMGARYLRIRFEDMCLAQTDTLTRLYHFLETPLDNFPEVLDLIEAPGSLGRWHSLSETKKTDLQPVGQRGLAHFGYL